MDTPRLMRRRERRRQLPHEVGHQRRSEGTGAVYVLGERFSVGPLEREVMQAFGLAVVVGAHDAGMLHPGAVARFPQEAFDRRGVATQARAQYLERTRTAIGVLRPIHLGRASRAHALEEAVAGDSPTRREGTGHVNALNL